MKFLKGGIRFLLVTVGIVVLTSFTIDATDSFSGSQTALSILAGNALESPCPKGTVRIDMADKSICIDQYENSVGEECGIGNPSSGLDTKKNIDTQTCVSVSKKEAKPWSFVSLHQAKALCAKKDMRLPSPEDWYEAGLGTPDTDVCNVSNGNVRATGVSEACLSSRGAYDMIGNLWEWVDVQVTDGLYQGYQLPESGYVSEIDTSGIATASDTSGLEMYNNDYFYSDVTGIRAMMRGGFYSGGADAGLFSTHTKVEPSFSSAGTGFRCIKTL